MIYFGLNSLLSCLFSKLGSCLVFALCYNNILENYTRLILSIERLLPSTIKLIILQFPQICINLWTSKLTYITRYHSMVMHTYEYSYIITITTNNNTPLFSSFFHIK